MAHSLVWWQFQDVWDKQSLLSLAYHDSWLATKYLIQRSHFFANTEWPHNKDEISPWACFEGKTLSFWAILFLPGNIYSSESPAIEYHYYSGGNRSLLLRHEIDCVLQTLDEKISLSDAVKFSWFSWNAADCVFQSKRLIFTMKCCFYLFLKC